MRNHLCDLLVSIKHRKCQYEIIFGQRTLITRVFYYIEELVEFQRLLAIGELEHRGGARARYLLVDGPTCQQVVGASAYLRPSLLFYLCFDARTIVILWLGLVSIIRLAIALRAAHLAITGSTYSIEPDGHRPRSFVLNAVLIRLLSMVQVTMSSRAAVVIQSTFLEIRVII